MDVIDNNPPSSSTSTSISRAKKKSVTIKEGGPSVESIPSTSNDLSNTKIGHDFDPEKRKSPSKRRSIVKPKRKPHAQGYYRRRLEFFDTKQNGTKDQVATFSEASSKGLEFVPSIMDGQLTPSNLFPLYQTAVDSYVEASFKLRQTVLTERKLAAEIWGDNNIASYDNGIYIVQKDVIEELLRPKIEDVKLKVEPLRRAAPKKKKEPIQEPISTEVVQVESHVDNDDLATMMEFSDNMPITRSRTKVIREIKSGPSPPPPPPPATAPPASSLNRKRKAAVASSKGAPQTVKKTRFSKDSSSNTPTPPPSQPSPPPPPPSNPSISKKNSKKEVQVKETPMPSFKMIEENKISRKAQDIIRDTKVLQCYCKSDVGCVDTCVNRILHMECGSRCPVGEQCQNKRFQKLQYAAFEPFFAGVKGWGIRATKPIKSGDFIVEYVGEVVDQWEMARRQKKYTKNNHKHHYMMSLRNGAVIDATTCGNLSRFVNHSCDPNAETQKWVVSREIRIGFFAKKDIAAGEEIVFDYAFERFGKEAQECYCGSENCTGFIGSKPDENDNDEEEIESSESTSEATDDENATAKEVENVVKKPVKLKRTKEEKEFRKEMAKKRRKLVKARRETRKIIGRKKNFTAEDILEFNRNMYRVNDYDQRFLLVNFLLSFPDDKWKKNFIEKNGIEVIWSWLNDFTGSVNLKTIVRLQNGLIKFIESLPIEYCEHVKLMRPYVKDIMSTQLPDDVIVKETLNGLLDSVSTDEIEIFDKELARMLDRDKVSMLDLYDETVEICKRLHASWLTLPSLYTDGCIEVSGDEMDDSTVKESTSYERTVTEPDLPLFQTMDTDFDTPEYDTPEYSGKPENEILDIGAKKHFSGSSSPDHPSEKENSQGKKCNSRSRSRSFSPLRRRRSPSINFQDFLSREAKKEYHDGRSHFRRKRDRSPDRSDYYRRDKRYYDDRHHIKHFKEHRPGRFHDGRRFVGRRRDDRRYDDRYRDGRSNYSRHNSSRHHEHHNERHFHRHRSPYEISRKRQSSSPSINHKSSSPQGTRKESPQATSRESPQVTRRESPAKGTGKFAIFEKTIKLEIPETSSVIKEEPPLEILPITTVTTIAPAVVSENGTSSTPPSPVPVSRSNTRDATFEALFPDAPKPVPPPTQDYTTLFSTPPPELPGMGPKFRSTMRIADIHPIRPAPIQFKSFRPRAPRPFRLPIVVPPAPVVPQQFPMSYQQQQWYGYPMCVPPPPPSGFQPYPIEPPVQFAQPIQIPLPSEFEATVPDPQPSSEMSKDSFGQTSVDYNGSSVMSVREIKKEELSPVVSDPIQNEPSPEEIRNEETETNKVKPYKKNPDWIETFTDDGIIYYYHKETRETRWEEPPPKEMVASRAVNISSNRHESAVSKNHEAEDLELKKQFKLKIWQNLYKYLKPRSELRNFDEARLTQFARKMTHKVLDVELKNGNVALDITEKVYLRARQITDQNYANFLIENCIIKTEPPH